MLILNSDSPHNRGDRAILAGMINLIRELDPSAEITSLSQFADRDRAWFGIDFLPMSPYSTSPVDYLRLLRAARDFDVILWGGGELLKDYTNKLSLFYWALKLWGIRRVNRHVYGAFQGIGPTKANISKRLITTAVNQCRAFLVRDAESAAKLTSWGARSKIIASYDPAVLMSPPVVGELGPSAPIGFGLRRWFHYRQAGWLPQKYKFWQRNRVGQITPREQRYIQNSARLADFLIERHDTPLVFFPMHMHGSEDDAGFARQVIAKMKFADRTSVIDADDLSPSAYLARIAECRFFVASRLHSAILATVANVPAVCLYYVDKGRLFFEQVGQQRFSLSIDEMQQQNVVNDVLSLTDQLIGERAEIQRQQREAIAQMRVRLIADLKEALASE